MDAVATQTAEVGDFVEAAIVELAAGVMDRLRDRESILTLITSRPEWQQQYQNLHAELAELDNGPCPVGITLEKQGERGRTVPIDSGSGTGWIDRIDPGIYTIRLSIGRILWQGTLTKEDLTWSHAFPGRALDLAADTGSSPREPTRSLQLLDGELTVRIYPDVEAGCMEIILRHSGRHQDV